MIARVLLSGGMDSAVCLAWAIHGFGRGSVECVFFSYGQRHRDREYAAAVEVARHFGVNHWAVKLDHLGGSSLTGDPGDLSGEAVVVPDRNATMLRQAARMFPPASVLVMGACADDWGVFPDCRPDFFDSMRAELSPISIETPLVNLNKRGVFILAQRYGGTEILEWTWSCYRGGGSPCGDCGACVARASAFIAPPPIDPDACDCPSPVPRIDPYGDDLECMACGGKVSP